MDEIRFVGALAGTNTSAKCLAVSRDGDAKLTLEIPASELAAVLRLLALGETAIEFRARVVG